MEKPKITLFLLALIILGFLTNCKKEDKEFAFGVTQTGFEKNLVYKTETNGLLYVKIAGDGLDWSVKAYILTGIQPEPADTIAIIDYFGSTTLPLKKNYYWKVTIQGPVKTVDISWTPIE